VPVPAFGPRLVLGRDMADSLLFISQRVVPEVLVSNGYRFEHPDLDEALAAIYR
jgi:NAD dependent epimerase/dehydratase family enzyme